MEKILFIGDCGNFKNTSNGVYAKNIQLFNRLKEVFVTLKHVNTNNWKKNPSVLLNVLRFIWQYRKKNIIISLNTYSSYKLIKIVKMLFPSIRLNYFVIGGILPNFISQLEMKGMLLHCQVVYGRKSRDETQDGASGIQECNPHP